MGDLRVRASGLLNEEIRQLAIRHVHVHKCELLLLLHAYPSHKGLRCVAARAVGLRRHTNLV